MVDEASTRCTAVARRDFLYVAALGSGAMLGGSLIASPAAAANKLPPKAVNYQPTPRGTQRCDNCVNFQPAASCKLVEGAISPAGWCTLYNAKK